MNLSREQKAGNGLDMASAQPAPRPEWRAPRPCTSTCELRNLRSRHKLILIDTDPKRLIRSRPMPIFEYICKACHHEFEALVYGKEKAECPKCHAKKLEPQLSVFAVSAK